MYRKTRLLLILFLYPAVTEAQEQVENYDLNDMVRSFFVDSITLSLPSIKVSKTYLSLLPSISYTPANGFGFGASLSFTRLFAPPPTIPSAASLSFLVTTKKQFIINARSRLYLAGNKWILQGDWRLLFFTQPTYGLGIHNDEGGINTFTINVNGISTVPDLQKQEMKYNYLRLHEDLNRKLGNTNWYAGIGLAFDYHSNIRDTRLLIDSLNDTAFLTSHFAYSMVRGFNPERYAMNGFNFTISSDTRDNTVNPYQGHLTSVSFRINPKFTGSSQASTLLSYDLRYYKGLSKKYPRNILCFWSWGTFVTSGNVPYLSLPALGWDTYDRSGRGFVQGRYRGLNMMYAEAEWRFPLMRNGFLGGVLFANATSAQSSFQHMFDKVAPGFGSGLRIKLDKHTRTNLNVDLTYGVGNSWALFMGIRETF